MDRKTASLLRVISALLRIIGTPFFYLLYILLAALLIPLSAIIFDLLHFIKVIFRSFQSLPSLTQQPLRWILKTIYWTRHHCKRPHISTPPIFNYLLTKPSFSLFFAFLITLFTLSVSSIIVGLAFLSLQLPHPSTLLTNPPAVTSVIQAHDGTPLYEFYVDENRHVISLSQIPTHVIEATLAIEDADFYHHPGFSIRGIVRAFRHNLTNPTLQGGSTITQQLVKNRLLTPERTWQRKLKEIALALWVESYFTKDEILTMYFNQVAYGGTAYGIEAAANYYFNKPASKLNLAESALLAGLPAAPSFYSPFRSSPHRAIDRQYEVLNRMVAEMYITSELSEQAKIYPLAFASPTTNILAPHFVMYVRQLVADAYSEEQLAHGGLTISTSLDLEIQSIVNQIVSQEMPALLPLNITNAAVLITQPQTGQVVAMLGSADYFNSALDGQVNVTLRPRQPGSSIKPLTYAMALEQGLSPLNQIADTPVTYHLAGSPPYTPSNYDNRFHGIVTLRQALANSYNIPAVKLLDQFGVPAYIDFATRLGISTWNQPSRYGLSLTLGGAEVTMADMAVAYGVFANAGQKVSLHPIISVTDFTGQLPDVLGCQRITPHSLPFTRVAQAASNPCQSVPVVSPETAFIISDILSDNQARTPTFGQRSHLYIEDHQVAVKTGTTNQLRDNWTIGYTSDYLVAVWVGNNDNSPMNRVASGVTGASPIFNRIMTKLLENSPPHQFQPPSSLSKVSICPLTKSLNCSSCPNPLQEWLPQDQIPAHSCSNELIERLLSVQSSVLTQ